MCWIHQRLYILNCTDAAAAVAIAIAVVAHQSFVVGIFSATRAFVPFLTTLPMYAAVYARNLVKTQTHSENEEICIVNCRFFVCFVLFVLTMFSLLFLTCTHFYVFSPCSFFSSCAFCSNERKQDEIVDGASLVSFFPLPFSSCTQLILWIILDLVFFFFHLSYSFLHHFMLYFILSHIFLLRCAL